MNKTLNQYASEGFDRIIEWVEDAFVYAFAPFQVRRGTALVGRSVARLPDHLAFSTELNVNAADPDVARRAFLMQAERLSPLPLDSVVWTVLRSADGEWRVVFVRRDDLDAERKRLTANGEVPGSFAIVGNGGVVAIFRDAPERARRRTFVARCMLVLLSLLAAGWFFLSSLEARWRAQIAEMDIVQGEMIADMSMFREHLGWRAPYDGVLPTVVDVQAFWGATSQARPDEWHGVSLEAGRGGGEVIYQAPQRDDLTLSGLAEELRGFGFAPHYQGWQSERDDRVLGVIRAEVSQ